MKKRTFMLKGGDCHARTWYLVDAKDKNLGRLCTGIARILQGKHKPTYTPHMLCGDAVVVVNGKFIKVTGKKIKEKIYKKYTGYPGGIREIPMDKLMAKNPTLAVRAAVKGMLPRTRLARLMLRNLKVYAEDAHTHQAQAPQRIEL